jgi:hypothetical protein
MKKLEMLRKACLMLVAVMTSMAVWAQGDGNMPSPPATATGKAGDATITVTYNSPAVKGRKVFGELVPYGKVWRAGANKATIFETDKDIRFGGKEVPAGKYSLYVLPMEGEWGIIINSETGQWGIKRGGDTTRDPSKDVAVATVKPSKAKEFNERLVYKVMPKGLSLAWENTTVFVPVK